MAPALVLLSLLSFAPASSAAAHSVVDVPVLEGADAPDEVTGPSLVELPPPESDAKEDDALESPPGASSTAERKGPLPKLEPFAVIAGQLVAAFIANTLLAQVTGALAFIPVIGLPLALLVQSVGIAYAVSAVGASFGDRRSAAIVPALAFFVVDGLFAAVGLTVYLGLLGGGVALSVTGLALLLSEPSTSADGTAKFSPEAFGLYVAGLGVIASALLAVPPLTLAAPLGTVAAIATHHLAGVEHVHTGQIEVPSFFSAGLAFEQE